MPSDSIQNRSSLNGIGRKLFLRILFYSLIISVASTGIHIFWEYRKEIQHQNNVVDEFEYTHKREITEAAWVSDIPLLKIQLDGLVHSQHFQFAQLQLPGQPPLSAGEPGAPHNMIREYQLEHLHNGRKIQLGILKIFLGLEHHDGSIFSTAKSLFAIQTFTVFFISILIFYLFQRMVGRHLTKITAYTRHINPQTLAEPLVLASPYDRPTHNDEISVLMKSINSMRVNLLADITERHRSKKALQESENNYRDFVEGTDDLIARVDNQGCFSFVNNKAEKYLGLSPKECIGVPAFNFVHPDDRQMTIEWFQQCAAQKLRKATIENRQVNSKTAAVFNILWTTNFEYDEQGNATSNKGIGRDITARKQAESELLTEKEKSQKYLNLAGFMFCALDTKGEITLINPKGCQILNINTKEDALGKNWFDHFLPKRMVTEVKEVFRKLMSGDNKPVEYYENPILTADGQERIIAFNNTILKNNAGNITGILFSGEDVTDLRHAEQEKAKLEAQLRQVYKMDALGTMAGGIAHDFNNILAIILGNAELIMDEISPGSDTMQSVGQIQQASLRAKDLISQILAFSRKEKMELIPIRPQSLIKETLKLLRSTTPTTVSIIQDIPEDCGVIMADPTQLHQLTMNLFTNAVHAMNEKGELTISLRQVEINGDDLNHVSMVLLATMKEAGKYVRLSITDTGRGIPKRIIARIFDPFYTTKEVGKGTGMGLAVVHGIIESHGGFITVESDEGKGSTFNVFFPVTEKADDLEIQVTSDLQGGTESILLVDDEESILKMALRMLEKLGYKVVPKISSTEALELFKSNPDEFDLLITDQSMPNLSGTDLIAEMLKIRPDLPIILCTGYSSVVSKENAREKGISQLINKPYDKKSLAKAIREVMDGQE